MIERDFIKIAFQMKESSTVPFSFFMTDEYEKGLSEYSGSDCWKEMIPPYIEKVTVVDNFLRLAGLETTPDGYARDSFGCVWDMGTTNHLIEPPLKDPSLAGYSLPDIDDYYERFVWPQWEKQLQNSSRSFRILGHSFGLFERAWSLRGFETFLMDFYDNRKFCEELIEYIADWFLQSIENMLNFPADAIMLTDDYAHQRGMIFSIDIFRHLFKPHWKRIFGRIRKAGVYSILHVCGNAVPAVPDLIECGLDCLESLQPEAMDIYELKKVYGKDLRFWGGLGVQSTLPFGTPQKVREDVQRLKRELGRGGGFVLNSAKPLDKPVPFENALAYLEEALKTKQ